LIPHDFRRTAVQNPSAPACRAAPWCRWRHKAEAVYRRNALASESDPRAAIGTLRAPEMW